MNQNSYNSNSLVFDQPQPPQSPVIHQPPQEMSIQEMEDLKKHTYPLKRFNSFCYDDDDDEDYTIAITPNLSTEKRDNSLSMGDEHLDTISATESDEFIKSSVENLVPIPSESEGIPDNMCDVPFHDNSPPLDVSKDQLEDFSDSNDEFSSTDDDSFSIDNIDYVEASPPDSELFTSEVMEIVIPEVGGIDDDILLTIKDDILREKLLNINLLIAKIDALNDNPTPSSDFMTKSSSTSLNSLLEETNTCDNSLPEFETFCFDVEEISSGSTTYSANSLLEEFTDELALITYPPGYNDNLQFDIDFDLKKIEFLLYQGKDSNLKDSIDQTDLANLDDNFVDPIAEMFTDEHAPDYSSPPIFDVYDDDFLKYDSFNSQDFSRVDALPSTNNEDKVFNPGILIHEKPVKIITRVVQEKKLEISNASLTVGDHRKVQLNEINELRDQAYENSLIYKEKTKRLHDSKIKDLVFNIDDRVLLFNSRLKIFSDKLKFRWSGRFTISHVFPYDTIELSQPDGPNFKVNGHRLKHYFGEDVPKLVVPDL
nr:reverse transcriptase domain-containing protein [Tanacetum cinerariifolium]